VKAKVGFRVGKPNRRVPFLGFFTYFENYILKKGKYIFGFRILFCHCIFSVAFPVQLWLKANILLLDLRDLRKKIGNIAS
jgi:hypothetical protein